MILFDNALCAVLAASVLILPNEALNPDLLQLVMKIHYNSTHAQ